MGRFASLPVGYVGLVPYSLSDMVALGEPEGTAAYVRRCLAEAEQLFALADYDTNLVGHRLSYQT
jgi:hypothetical protein